MTPAATRPPKIARPGEPVWEIAELFPEQGLWTEKQYLALSTNRLVEFDNGTIEVLPVPTKTHQLIVAFFYEVLKSFIAGHGRVFFAPYRLRIRSGRFREPDVLYLTPEQDARAGEEFTESAELVVEVVSPDDPDRDYVTKRRDYSDAGVPEYWIIDRTLRQVIVLRLDNGEYVETGRFGPGQRADSHRLPGFTVAVDDVLAQGRPGGVTPTP
jgi:Uma2 family endonuclease